MIANYYYESPDDLIEDLKQRLTKMDASTARRLNKQLSNFAYEFTDTTDLPQNHDVHKFISTLIGALHWIELGKRRREELVGKNMLDRCEVSPLFFVPKARVGIFASGQNQTAIRTEPGEVHRLRMEKLMY